MEVRAVLGAPMSGRSAEIRRRQAAGGGPVTAVRVSRAPEAPGSRLMPVTDEMLAEVKRLAYEAAAGRNPLAVLPILLLSLIGEIERLRAEVESLDPEGDGR